jgi:hypothetical protein
VAVILYIELIFKTCYSKVNACFCKNI